jgi:ribonuclease HI
LLLKIYTDGASRNNPGHAGIGIVIYDENNFIVKTYKEYIGKATNNQAEYMALIKSVELVMKFVEFSKSRLGGKEKEGIKADSIEFYSDSELLVNQINFDYKVKDPDLALLNNKFHVLMKKLNKPYRILHIERGKNSNADLLANKAIDTKLKK